MTLTCVSEWGIEVDSRLLAALALGVVKRLGGETVVVDEDNNIRTGWRLAHVGDVALLEKPADHQSLKRIDCYLIEEENFAGGNRFKLDPQRVLFSLQYQHNAIPPDFDLLLFRDPRQWFGAVTALLGELNRHAPHLFDKLRAADETERW